MADHVAGARYALVAEQDFPHDVQSSVRQRGRLSRNRYHHWWHARTHFEHRLGNRELTHATAQRWRMLLRPSSTRTRPFHGECRSLPGFSNLGATPVSVPVYAYG
jgi:hypothetical protein